MITRVDSGAINQVLKNPYAQLKNYLMCYDYGDECAAVTGGWAAYAKHIDAWGTPTAPILTKRTHSMSINQTNYNSRVGFVATANTMPWTTYTGGKVLMNGIGLTIVGSSNYRILAPSSLTAEPTGYSGSIPIFYGSSLAFMAPTVMEVAATSDVYLAINVACVIGAISAEVFHVVMLKNDDRSTLCTKAGLTPGDYATDLALCASSTAMTAILANRDSVNFLVAQCTGTIMGEFISSATAVAAYLASPYKSLIDANVHWDKFLAIISL